MNDHPTSTPNSNHDAAVVGEMNLRLRRSLMVGGAAGLAGFGGLSWLGLGQSGDGISAPRRTVLRWNEALARNLLGTGRLAPEHPVQAAKDPRVNGRFGLENDFDPRSWKLQVEPYGGQAAKEFTLDDLRSLPRVESVTELKCIEGWSEVVQWAGVRLADFATKFSLATLDGSPPQPGGKRTAQYVALETPGRSYYVGLDMASALHPQTILAYEMNGAPLSLGHGAPLRLAIPVKYGIKNIKRIGLIRFTDQRPGDYWAERGYDWYAGL